SAETALAAHEGEAHRAAVRAIALGTIRWYLRLAPALDLLLKHPAGVTGTVRSLLTVAVHQIEYSRNSPEATVDAAVDAARLLGAERATGLANAVLRRFVAERGALLGRVDTELPPRTAHPAWIVERIAAAWPQACPAILAANNGHPPMTLRLDLSRTDRTAYLIELSRASTDAHVVVADVRDTGAFWDGRPFERILVDAPCSSSGVIRRHPDIKLLRRAEDIPALAALQLAILRAAAGMLTPGGRLLYATCSVLP